MASPKKPVLTARETELAGLVWQCFEVEPKINFKKLADLAGFKNAATASACWGPAKKKLMANAGIATPTKTPTKRGAAAVAVGNENQATPTKKPRKNVAKAAKNGNGNGQQGATMDADVPDDEDDKNFDLAINAQLTDDQRTVHIKEEDDKNSNVGNDDDDDDDDDDVVIYQDGEV